MLRKRRKKHRAPLSQEVSLQITSLADIFTILLVFLIKSFSTTPSSLTAASDLHLPVVPEAEPIVDTFRIEVARNELLFEGHSVVSLKNFQFSQNDLEKDGSVRLLNTALDRELKKVVDKSRQARVLLLADQEAPYKTLKNVLHSASLNGIIDYKLVVVEDK